MGAGRRGIRGPIYLARARPARARNPSPYLADPGPPRQLVHSGNGEKGTGAPCEIKRSPSFPKHKKGKMGPHLAVGEQARRGSVGDSQAGEQRGRGAGRRRARSPRRARGVGVIRAGCVRCEWGRVRGGEEGGGGGRDRKGQEDLPSINPFPRPSAPHQGRCTSAPAISGTKYSSGPWRDITIAYSFHKSRTLEAVYK